MFGQKAKPEVKIDPCCAICHFFRDQTCRRHAPSPVMWGPFEAATKDFPFPKKIADESVVWPETRKTDWCGECQHSPENEQQIQYYLRQAQKPSMR